MNARRIALATGLTYNVLEWEAPGDTTFVLVHGFLDLAYAWHEVAPQLGAHVIAPDLRGHGDTDWIGPGGYYHFFDYVADLDEVIARLARKRVIVVGHSMGGGVTSYWAATRRDRPTAIALLEGLGPPEQSMDDLPERTARWIEAWRHARSGLRLMSSLEEAAARLRKHDARLGEALSLRLAVAGTRAVVGGFAWKHDPLHLTMGPYPFRVDHAARYWSKIACPVLVVDGAESAFNLAEAERAARRAHFTRCTHHTIAGAAHMMLRHQPTEIARLLAGFARDA